MNEGYLDSSNISLEGGLDEPAIQLHTRKRDGPCAHMSYFHFYVHQHHLAATYINQVQEAHFKSQTAKQRQHKQDVNQQGCPSACQ